MSDEPDAEANRLVIALRTRLRELEPVDCYRCALAASLTLAEDAIDMNLNAAAAISAGLLRMLSERRPPQMGETIQ